MNFEEVLKQKRLVVWKEISKYFENPLPISGNLAIPKEYAAVADFHWQITSEYPRRQGKYLRPTLTLLAAEAMGFPTEKALKTAAAMQTSEDWVLIHDDFEDGSLERRGKPTLHLIYGPALAVNGGDALHIIMWKMLWDNYQVVGEKKALEIINEFYLMLTRTALGQTVEQKWIEENRMNLTNEDIFFTLDGKTSYYTISGPMRLGAILAGATSSQLDKLYEFGQYLGRCFQIKDDLLDLTSDFSGLKKQRGNDIYEGKRTVMLMHLSNQINGREKLKLTQIMAKKREDKSREEVDWVISMMEEHGSLEYGEELAEELYKEAKKLFENNLKFLKNQPARDQLKECIEFILNRSY